MKNVSDHHSPVFGRVKTTADLGQMMRSFRKSGGHTLETLSGLSNLGIRFLSELERGKETAEIGKALRAIEKLGLEVIIQPRGYDQLHRKQALKAKIKELENNK